MGFDWEFVVSVMPIYGAAILLTIKIAVLGTLLSLLVGAVCSLLLYYRVKVAGSLVKGYIELSRNTPLVIQLFFLYYGLPKLGIMLPNEVCAIFGLTFLGGGYMAESFRSGLDAVSSVQLDLGLSIGLNTFQMIRFVVFPQALSVAMPSLGANCVFLIKETSVVSIIALRDLMSVTKELIGMYYNTVESLLLLVVCYLLILLPVSFLLIFLERRFRYAEFGV
ncbi:MAG: amino acid ABC transporter permease [Synergistaceae bacterium]|jgi:polar amino acid transport system permease protein|nr:amino acid ABC transporter permease [Synergistaceae bacterium]